MVDAVKTYDNMNAQERELAQRDFNNLPDTVKRQLAEQAISSGQQGPAMAYADKLYGDGDGQWTEKDNEKLRAAREDKAFNEGLVKASEAMLKVATIPALPAYAGGPHSFALGAGGVLGGVFNSNANAEQFAKAPSADHGHNASAPGFVSKLANMVGLG